MSGNSLGIRIPVQFAKKLHLLPGSPVDIEIQAGKFIIQTPKYDLSTMLEAITPQNCHHLSLENP